MSNSQISTQISQHHSLIRAKFILEYPLNRNNHISPFFVHFSRARIRVRIGTRILWYYLHGTAFIRDQFCWLSASRDGDNIAERVSATRHPNNGWISSMAHVSALFVRSFRTACGEFLRTMQIAYCARILLYRQHCMCKSGCTASSYKVPTSTHHMQDSKYCVFMYHVKRERQSHFLSCRMHEYIQNILYIR